MRDHSRPISREKRVHLPPRCAPYAFGTCFVTDHIQNGLWRSAEAPDLFGTSWLGGVWFASYFVLKVERKQTKKQKKKKSCFKHYATPLLGYLKLKQYVI
jgi:hypothetical protein